MQVGDIDTGTARQWMPGRKGRDQAFAIDEFGRELVAPDRRPQQGDVDLVRRQRIILHLRDHLGERQIDVGHFAPARGDELRQKRVSRCGRIADPERTAFAGCDAPRHQRRPVGHAEQAAGLGEKAFPGGRQPDRPAGAIEQRRADAMLEFWIWRLSGGCVMFSLRDGAAEMQLFRHRDETAYLAEVEHRSTLRNDLAD